MRYLLIFLLVSLSACQPDVRNNKVPDKVENNFPIYSSIVKDSFMINVYLPDTSLAGKPSRYPVIYILDANLYFDIYATIVKKYSEVGLLPPAILVGIGYNTFQQMDSLRQRDYTFPEGLPEYEMPVSGKANLFLEFIQNELIPIIDKKYPSDTARRMITGHSMGGYFTLYALLEDLRNNRHLFTGYIAASPSLHFNNNYLLKQFDIISDISTQDKKVFIAYGSLENPDMGSINFSKSKGTKLRKLNFSELDHMDTQVPAFIKGLQWLVSE